ncbi:MAG: hypothetical protein LBV60_14555 [Streptomyces sp.]|jgi:hypothetical protein|nr:hypothetical protein [Streptomyces sp.]
MPSLPGQRPTTTAGQPATDTTDQARLFLAAIEDAMRTPTSYRDDTPLPLYGTAPPVPQPGIPPMSQRSTDIGRTALYCGLATVPPGLIAIGVLLASGQANPTVVAWICAAPAALAVPVVAVARLVKGAKEAVEAAPREEHHHYNAPVHQEQRHVHSRSSGLWAKTINNQ